MKIEYDVPVDKVQSNEFERKQGTCSDSHIRADLPPNSD